MKNIAVTLLTLSMAGPVSILAQMNPPHAETGATSLNVASNLPVERIGKNDLVGITVYDSPELTRTVRVSSDGEISLPMLEKHIRTEGLYPAELETAIKAALMTEQVLVDPIVTVSVVEYRSRPISVVGAVKSPATFQATGEVTLLDAISQAGGLTENAGAEILVSKDQSAIDGKSAPISQRIPVRGLYDATDPSLNMKLQGGEVVRIPEAGRVYVVGDVKKPGMFFITDGSESSVLKALSLSEGLDRFSGHTAFIYRPKDGSSGRNEIPIELKKIMDRKSPDVAPAGERHPIHSRSQRPKGSTHHA